MNKNKSLIKVETERETLKLNLDMLKMVCNLKESSFELLEVDGKTPEVIDTRNGNLLYWNRGHKILAVAHLDTYGAGKDSFVKIGSRVYNASLDDRLGVYTILHQLIKFDYDILLTTGEESGMSTAQWFESKKQFNWMFSFDRGGSESVLYEYSSKTTKKLLKKHGWRVGMGSFSDISYLEHMDCKGFNFATEYYDYHGDYAYMKIQEYFKSIRKFESLYQDIKNTLLEHEESNYSYYGNQLNHYNWSNYPYEKTTAITTAKKDKMNCAYCDELNCDCEQVCESCGFEGFDYEFYTTGFCYYCVESMARSDAVKLDNWSKSNSK